MNRNTLAIVLKVCTIVLLAFGITGLVRFMGGQSALQYVSFFMTLVFGILGIFFSGGVTEFSVNIEQPTDSQDSNTRMASRLPDIEWSDDTEENLKRLNKSPIWRKVEEPDYNQRTKLGSYIKRISDLARSGQYISQNHIRALLIIVPVVGLTWFSILLIEMLAAGSFAPGWISWLAEISPLTYSIQNVPLFQLMTSIALFVIPIGYLDWKDDTTCSECNKAFALESRGKFWHPSLTESRERDGQQETIRRGARFLECRNCGNMICDSNYSWEEDNS